MTYTPNKIGLIVEEYVHYFLNQYNRVPSEGQVMEYIKIRTKYPFSSSELWKDIWFKWKVERSASFLKNYFLTFGFKNPKVLFKGMNPLQEMNMSKLEKKEVIDFLLLFES